MKFYFPTNNLATYGIYDIYDENMKTIYHIDNQKNSFALKNIEGKELIRFERKGKEYDVYKNSKIMGQLIFESHFFKESKIYYSYCDINTNKFGQTEYNIYLGDKVAAKTVSDKINKTYYRVVEVLNEEYLNEILILIYYIEDFKRQEEFAAAYWLLYMNH